MNAELVKVETHGIHDELVYSSFLKSYEIVALSDSVPEALIKFPDRILFAEDRIFVVDKADNKLLMFDREGNFLKSTASMVGKGHNEYIRLMDVAMDKESRTLYVHCDAPYQIMVFDFDLNLKEVVQTDFIWTRWWPTGVSFTVSARYTVTRRVLSWWLWSGTSCRIRLVCCCRSRGECLAG